MERQQAFTVLPPLSPRLPPPPPTPAPTRMAPRTVAHKDNSAFVILAEIGDPPSGRSSPFRGRGFRAPSPPSRIPILSGKSAPSSPVRSKIVVVGGKSAPASPKRVTAKPPQPRKRNESPSQIHQSRRNSPASLLKDPPNRRLTAKPPVPKPNSPRRNLSNTNTTSKTSNVIIKNNIIKNIPKTPQPAKREVSKPMPAVRTRLNNKPVSTDLKIGLNNKSERPTLATPAVAKRSAEKLVSNSRQKENKDKGETKEIKADEKAAKETQNEIKPVESVSATPAEAASVHKMNEVNIEKSEKKSDSEPKEETVKEKAKNEEIVRVEVEPEKKDAVETVLAEISEVAEKKDKVVEEVKVMVNGVAGAVKDNEMTEIVLEKPAETKVEINGLVGSGDPTLVEWTTKQPMELAQPDIIPTDSSPIVGVKETTVEGPPEVEVEAGNHTVTFRSPEIHPVSPRVSKAASLYSRISERMVSCCKKDRKKMNVIKVKGPVKAPPVKSEPKPSIFSRLCKWKRKPRPPPKPKAKGPQTSLLSRINCCKGKGLQRNSIRAETTPPTISTVTATPPPQGKSVWRTVFCLDKACCAKCKRNNQDAKKKEKTRRSSSIVGFPKLDGALVEHSSVMKGAIPVLPICLAWFCLLLNVFLPGIGTIISGFLCTCFGKPRFSVNDSAVARLGSLCVNVIVGISQMFTILFCLVGWGWSIWWGVIMVKMSRKNRRIKLAEKASESNPAPVVNQNHDVEHG